MFEGVQDYEKFGNHCPRPILICILPQQIHRLRNLNRTPHCPSHLDKRNTYVRMLFIDFSSAFNPILPTKLINKLRTLGLNTSLCNWILDFLTGRPQVVRAGNNTSAMLILNIGDPHGVCN